MRNSWIVLVVLVAAGCSGGETAQETKPQDVHVNLPKEQQDKLAADLQNFVPDKKK